MVIDSNTVGRVYALRQTIKADEKIVVRHGAILEVGKKTKLERIKERVINALCKIR